MFMESPCLGRLVPFYDAYKHVRRRPQASDLKSVAKGFVLKCLISKLEIQQRRAASASGARHVTSPPLLPSLMRSITVKPTTETLS
jgi:hypothetical protein